MVDYGVKIQKGVSIRNSEFVYNKKNYVLFTSSVSTIYNTYFISNDKDVSVDTISGCSTTLYNCFTDKSNLNNKGSVIISNISYYPYPIEMNVYATAVCEKGYYPTLMPTRTPKRTFPPPPTPARTVGECAPPQDPRKANARRFRTVYCLVNSFVCQ